MTARHSVCDCGAPQSRHEQRMQAIGLQPHRAPDGVTVHCERHRPEQTTLYRLVQQHAAIFSAEVEAAAGADLPQSAQGRVRCLPRMRHPGPRLPAPALR